MTLERRMAGQLPSSGPLVHQMMDHIVSQQTIARSCTPEDVSDAMSFLVSDEAGFITGQIIHVDGGRTRSGA